MMTSDVRLICFDLGRVLIRICDDWREACSLAGVSLPEGLLSAERAARFKQVNVAHELGRISNEAFYERAGEAVGLPAGDVRKLLEVWLRGAYPGVAELIEYVMGLPVRVACLSNTNACHWAMMTAGVGPNALPLERLHYRFASQELGLAKPDGAIFEHVERTVGVRGGEILFFDDHGPNFEAARGRGWRAVQVPLMDDPPGWILERIKAGKY
ncbi:MAG: HAD-IA family hydrolase [Phycisphaeraceae bacterium]|nr:HAD-IA family hydrolase [Phycisphaeraceae bacterium]